MSMFKVLNAAGGFSPVQALVDSAGRIVPLAGIVLDSTRAYAFNPDDLPQILTYGGPSGVVDTITVGPDALGFSYKQTLTYTGANVTAISAWVKQ
jgi:hypothetical protein